jgi:hypothetical protein
MAAHGDWGMCVLQQQLSSLCDKGLLAGPNSKAGTKKPTHQPPVGDLTTAASLTELARGLLHGMHGCCC